MPRPVKGESEKTFVSRYVGNKEAASNHPNQKQRIAIAYSLYERRKGKRKANTVLSR